MKLKVSVHTTLEIIFSDCKQTKMLDIYIEFELHASLTPMHLSKVQNNKSVQILLINYIFKIACSKYCPYLVKIQSS